MLRLHLNVKWTEYFFFLDLIGVCVFIYIDDIIVFSKKKTLEDHISNLGKVFKNFLNDNEFKNKYWEMYLFFKNKVTSLSLVTFFLPKVISPIPEKVKGYYKLAGFLLKTKTQLRILPLALLVITESLFTTLHKLHIHCSNDLKERCSFLFGPEDCNSRFSKNWKNKLVKCPYLNTFLTIRNHFIIRTDDSRIGLRWCFYFQVKDNIEVPIYFWK